MHLLRLTTAFWILLLPVDLGAQELVDPPSVILTDVPFQLTLHGANDASTQYDVRSANGVVLAQGTVSAQDVSIVAGLEIRSVEQLPLQVLMGERASELELTLIPGWFSLLPPILAIALALIFREVITALFAGVWLGALAVAGFNPLAATGRLLATGERWASSKWSRPLPAPPGAARSLPELQAWRSSLPTMRIR